MPLPSSADRTALREPVEAALGECVEQCLPIDEVAPRCTVADAGLARELPEREPVDAGLAQDIDSACSSRTARRFPWWKGRGHGSAYRELVIDYFLDSD